MKPILIIVLISLTALTLAIKRNPISKEQNKIYNNIPYLKEKLENYEKNYNFDEAYESEIKSIIAKFIKILYEKEDLTYEENKCISLFVFRVEHFVLKNITNNVKKYIKEAKKVIEEHENTKKTSRKRRLNKY